MGSVRTIQNAEYSRNVPETERWISAIAGGALLTYGLKTQGTALRVVTGVAAAGLFHRAVTGHCMLYSALNINRTEDRSGVVSVRHGHGNKIEKSVTIDKPAHGSTNGGGISKIFSRSCLTSNRCKSMEIGLIGPSKVPVT